MYALFAGTRPEAYDDGIEGPKGGWLDIKALSNKVDDLLGSIILDEYGQWFIVDDSEVGTEKIDWWHVIDLSRRMVVRSNIFADDWDQMADDKLIFVDGFFRKMSNEEKRTPTERTKV